MSVSITRKRTFAKSYTVVTFDKDHRYIWPTNEHEHAEIEKIYLQDKPYEGIQNNFTKWRKLFDETM